MEWTDQIIHVFIDMVREAPMLYDKCHCDFKFPAKKTKQWDAIGEALNTTGDICSKKWGNLRERFAEAVREVKELPTGSQRADFNYKKDKFVHFSALSFLTKHIKGRKTYTNLTPMVPEGSQESEDAAVENREPETESIFPTSASSISGESGSQNNSFKVPNNSVTPSTSSNSGRKRPKWILDEEHCKLTKELSDIDSSLKSLRSSRTGPDESLANDMLAVLTSVEDEFDRIEYRLEIRDILNKIEREELKRKRERAREAAAVKTA